MKILTNKPWTVRNKFRGELTNNSVAVVMNNSRDRDNLSKVLVNYFITENIELLAGQNTAAIFKLKKQVDEKVRVTIVEELSLNSTSLFTDYLNKKKSAATVNSDTQ